MSFKDYWLETDDEDILVFDNWLRSSAWLSLR